ncbi:MAG: hypothetical protein V1917_01415 [Candidatus Gottesmanbacteria bacterium]
MWLPAIGITSELILLSFIARRFTQTSFVLLMRIIKSRSIAITIITLFLFPGTVIHELSHLFTAEIFGVKTGTLTLAPESIEGNDIQSGSVAIAKTDPFRRTLIGMAPTINGSIAVTALSWWLMNIIQYERYILIDTRFSIIFIFYLILTISNTMFTSREDTRGMLPVFLTVVIITAALYISGIRVGIPPVLMQSIQNVLRVLFQNLAIVLGINVVGLSVFSGILLLIKRR